MVNPEKIREVNKALPKMTIKGKEYVMVKDRVAAFRELFPDWSIENEIVQDDGVTITIKTTIRNEDGRIIATAHAQERYNATQINKTSALENCETSSLGRAIGLLNIGTDDSFASANEVENAQVQQAAGEKWPELGDTITGADVAKLRAILGDEQRVASVLKFYHLESLTDMTYAQFRDCVKRAGGAA